MKVLVVGGAGFVGSHLVDQLLAAGNTVEVIDNLSSGSLQNLAAARQAGGGLRFHHLDVGAPETASVIASLRPDVVYHLGLFPLRRGSTAQLGDAFASTLSLVEAARRAGVAKLVTAVPATVIYGYPAAKDVPVKEAEPVSRDVRGVVARAVIDLLNMNREHHALEFSVLAMGNVYGRRQRPDGGVVAAFVDAARSATAPTVAGTGRQTRDFVYVDDAVDALARAATRGGGLVINVGTGVATSVIDLWELISERIAGAAAPVAAPARAEELGRFALSSARARIHLGWSAWTTLAEGLDALA